MAARGVDARTGLAFVFGLVGGVLTLVVPFFFLGLFFGPYYGGPFIFGLFGFITALVSGALVILGASMVFRRPQQGVTWGIVMVVFGAMSGFGFGGFGIGLALAIAGGALAMIVGASPGAVVAPLSSVRACLGCGSLNPISFVHCPHCGRAMAPPPLE